MLEKRMNLNGMKQRLTEGIDGISCQHIQLMTDGATATTLRVAKRQEEECMARMRKIPTIKLHQYGHPDDF